MSTRKAFFEICKSSGHMPSKSFARPTAEYSECVTFRGLDVVTEIQIHLQHEYISPELKSQKTDITTSQSFAVLSLYLWCHIFHLQHFYYNHCLSKMYIYALNNMYFKLFIADQFFSHVNKDGADSLHYVFIFYKFMFRYNK